MLNLNFFKNIISYCPRLLHYKKINFNLVKKCILACLCIEN